MNNEEIQARLARILAEDFRVASERIDADATIRGSLGLDSLDVVDFIYFVEKEFSIKNDLAAYRTIDTVGKLVSFIQSQATSKEKSAEEGEP